MQLKSLEINGFKSFAKKAGLSFTTSITSIVGPNGSGKSNVAESFRFVLGEQSLKSLRGKKGEDMIFNGGKDSPRANRASVKIVFDNSNRIFNMDFDEISIERAVHRDGVNEYFINGTSVRLKDVNELLAHANIGSSGHHIISQGEADRLLSAAPKERREMIEDALGLKVYQYKKEESEKKLEKTANHMKEVESLRREIAPHIKFLRKQVEKIEKAVQLRGELVGVYQEYFARETSYLKHEQHRLAEQKKVPLEEIRHIQEELSHHKNVLDKAKKEESGHGKSSELISLESEMRDTRSKKDACMRELGRLEGEVSYLKRLIEKKLKEASETSTKQVYLREVEAVSREVEAKIAVALEVFGSKGVTVSEGDGGTRNDAASGSAESMAMAIELGAEDVSRVVTLLQETRESLTGFVQHHKESDGNAHNSTDNEQADIIRITEDMKGLEHRLSEYSAAEQEQSKRYSDIKLEIDKEKDKNVESEKAILRLMSRQNELHSHVESIKAKEDRVRGEEEDYRRELQEAAMLVGRDAVAYEVYIERVRQAAATPAQADDQADSQDSAVAKVATASGTDSWRSEDRHVQIDRRRSIEKIKIRLEEMGGAGGDDVMREYKETEERDAFLARELQDLVTSSASLKHLIEELDQKLYELFKEGIGKINKEFDHFFGLMFGGGRAELKLVREEKRKRKKVGEDGMDDLEALAAADGTEEDVKEEEGIDINVSLPHKRIKGLTMLSGGERALTSIALLFAMSQVNPPPFVILDETDAALDEANSRKYGDMIEALSKHSQLILITHNRETMSRAGVIYGVTMGGDGASKLLSIAFDEALAVAK